MLIEVSCECGRSVEVVDEDLLGKSLPCPTCGKSVVVPDREKAANDSTREVVPLKPAEVAAAKAARAAPKAADKAALFDGDDETEVTEDEEDTAAMEEPQVAAASAAAPKPALFPADAGRCSLCGRRFRKSDVICEGCGTHLGTGEPPPVKRFAGRRFDSRYVSFGAIVIALAGATIGVYRAVRAGADARAVREARERMAAGDYGEGERLYRRAIAIDERNAEAWTGLAEALVRTGHPQDAADHALTALKLHPQDMAPARAVLGRAWLDQGRNEEALEALKAAAKERPDLPSIRHWLGQAHFQKGEIDEAIGAYEEALSADPRSPDAPLTRLNLAKLYLQKGRTADAEKVLAQVKSGALEADSLAVLGDLYAQQGKPDEAEKAYASSLKVNAKQAWVFFKLARLKWHTGNREDARLDLDRAKAIDASPGEFWKLEGQMRSELGDPKGAMAALREACKRKARDVEAFLLLARLEIAQQDPAKAREDLAAALKVDPGYGDALVELGDLARKQKDWKTAVDSYRRAAAQAPENGMLRFRFAEVLEESGANADALNEYRAAAQADPRADAPRRRLAAIYLATQRPREAAAELEEIIKIKPDDADAKVKLASIRIGEKKYDAAIGLLKPVVDKDPQNTEAKLLLEKAQYKKFQEGQ